MKFADGDSESHAEERRSWRAPTATAKAMRRSGAHGV
jgi:hypothetical protein